MTTGDTIAAISSAVGPAARMIVRASGPLVRRMCAALLPSPGTPGEGQGEGSGKGNEGSGFRVQGASSSFILHPSSFPHHSVASYCRLSFNRLSVPAWVYLFAAPHSVTGEDVIELHIPGNPLLARMLLDELIRLGARQADPGEFTARAYFNGRIDLAEAEGVAATIAAQSERELSAARQLMAGELTRRLRPVMDGIAETLALIEVGIDFSEEDVTFLSQEQINERISSADAALARMLAESSRFERISHEPQVVLVGRPNAGKSTLLNALAGHDRAIVSPVAGTTRDAIWAHVSLSRGMVRVIDIAGLDEGDARDEISRSMQEQARRTIEQADVVVLVHDCTDERPPLNFGRDPDLCVETKIDLLVTRAFSPCESSACVDETDDSNQPHGLKARVTTGGALQISAACGANLDRLRERLDALAFGEVSSAASLALNARHVQAIQEARESLARACQGTPGVGPEVVAMELREALDLLGTILGGVTPDDVLGRVFSSFCIGK